MMTQAGFDTQRQVRGGLGLLLASDFCSSGSQLLCCEHDNKHHLVACLKTGQWVFSEFLTNII